MFYSRYYRASRHVRAVDIKKATLLGLIQKQLKTNLIQALFLPYYIMTI